MSAGSRGRGPPGTCASTPCWPSGARPRAADALAVALAEAPPGEDLRAWLKYADALAAAGRAAEAVSALRVVTLRHTGTPGADAAAKRLRRLRWQLPPADWRARTAPAPADALLTGRALLDDHQGEALEALMLASLRRGDAQPGEPAWCETWWLLARARTRQRHHGEAAAAYERVAEDCPDAPEAPDALYALGRAAFTVDDHRHALDALERLRDRYPTHRLAGDSLAIAARVHLDLGEVDAARDLRLRLLHDHSDDDTSVDALWGLFQDDPAAVADVDPTEVERAPDVRGRLHVFQGLDHEAKGDAAAAAADWEAAVRQGPMSYYALVALNHLRRLDPRGFPARVARLLATPTPAPPLAMFVGEPLRDEGLALLRLGFAADAWWAYSTAGPGPYGRSRYQSGLSRLFALAGAEGTARRILAREVGELDDAWPVGDERDRFEAVYPREFAALIDAAAVERGLPPALVYAIARTESRFDPTARSWAGACGLFQLLPATATELAHAEGLRGRVSCRALKRPALAVQLGTRYLADLQGRFGPHPGVVIAGYHAGPGNLSRWMAPAPFAAWLEGLPFVQTRLYVKRVLQAMWVYAWLLAEPGTPAADRVPYLPATVGPQPSITDNAAGSPP
ncbi:MAG: transglycosylase SLT domain-containing protein [Myxococcales bacterium]|nr:transglycosylase SLT domain-containing protein [Myxococcales bacterium]